ncbi:Major Facilitator Superfamily protein [Leuconostocaceae bacterium R-53105]|uniref:MFS transporter n=1 Tax=Convivina intestini TaxID=1505726 RepID=A0A2U1DFB0_9LACO|nr:MFS transporter [Convivina intestini]CAH1850608.1 hypothetical protein R077811_00125 [Convivina intestini]SDB83033.1 Major Facilitator Superfamily protein [Leuconostocaceae bacterium R-53105]
MGGYIVDNLGWHWVFFINVPLGVIVFLIIFTTYHDSKLIHQKSKMDFLGIASLSILLVSVLLLFQGLSVSKINWVLMAFLTLVILLATLVLIKVEQQAIDPIVPLNLFGNQLFLVQIFTTLALSAIQIGFQTYFPMWFQSLYHASPSLAGLAVTPSPILWLLSSFLVGSLVEKFAPKYIALPLIIVMALTYLPLVFASINFPEYLFYVISGVTGFVLGIVITMNTLIAQHVVSQKDLGTASSMITLGRTLGQTIATGIFGLIFNLTIHHEIFQQPTISENMVNQFISSNNHGSTMVGKNFDVLAQAVLSGMHAVFLVTLILFVLVIILNLSDKKRTIVK